MTRSEDWLLPDMPSLPNHGTELRYPILLMASPSSELVPEIISVGCWERPIAGLGSVRSKLVMPVAMALLLDRDAGISFGLEEKGMPLAGKLPLGCGTELGGFCSG